MNRTLRRPMFRRGGSAEGITSGLDKPKDNRIGFSEGSTAQNVMNQMEILDQVAPQSNSNFNNFLISTGLDLASRPASGNIFSQVASSAKEPFGQFQQAEAGQGTERRALAATFLKGLSQGDKNRIEQEIQMRMSDLGEDRKTASENVLNKRVYGVLDAPGEVEKENVGVRAESILSEKDVLGNSLVGYDTAIKIAEAVQPIFKGEVEGINKEDIDTDQLYIEKELISGMKENPDTGNFTIETEDIDLNSNMEENYVEGMVYYNYRNGKFYKKAGKQFIPIEQKES